jgi:hypothetical protein
VVPSALFKEQKAVDKDQPKTSKSLVEEYKAKLAALQASFQAKEKELAQAKQRVQEVTTRQKTDEAVIRKNMQEIDRLKKEVASKPPPVRVVQPAQDKKPIVDVEDMKTKLMDKFTTQLETIFVQNADEPSRNADAELISNETKNSSLDDKEKLIQAVQKSQQQFRAELGELFSNQWNSKISDLKNSMR